MRVILSAFKRRTTRSAWRRLPFQQNRTYVDQKGFLEKFCADSEEQQEKKKPPAVVELCPLPSCSCRPTPSDLEIDRTSSLNRTSPHYHEHLIFSTGKTDWPSKIESDPGAQFIRDLKEQFRPPTRQAVRRSGKFYNVRFQTNT